MLAYVLRTSAGKPERIFYFKEVKNTLLQPQKKKITLTPRIETAGMFLRLSCAKF
jgi:hypothetical protein